MRGHGQSGNVGQRGRQQRTLPHDCVFLERISRQCGDIAVAPGRFTAALGGAAVPSGVGGTGGRDLR
jgi:hypothetical protein